MPELAANAVEIRLFIRHGVIALRLPYRLAQAFQQQVQRIVIGSCLRLKLCVQPSDTAGLIDRYLLGERDVQRQVKEGVELPIVGQEITADIAVLVLQQRVILGMQQHHFERGFLQSFERRLRAIFAPGREEESAHFFARRIEHETKYEGGRMKAEV